MKMAAHPKNRELIVIAGPTAVGKTSLSIAIAEKLGTEIISADSRQIYREMKIGTAVPSSLELSRVKHHFIQTVSIHDYYNASKYEDDVNLRLSELFRSHDRVVMCGGSGLYIDAVCKGIDLLPEIDPEVRQNVQKKLDSEGLESLLEDLLTLDPDSFSRIDLSNPKRVQKALEISIITGKPYSSFLTAPRKKRDYVIKKLAINMDREELYQRINSRVIKMMDEGLEAEARELYPYRSSNALNTVGYRELFSYFEGSVSLEDAVTAIQSNTRNYARKQLTWFRKDSETAWFHPSETEKILKYINT
jgi:tRNA dimethylallyltransferase